MGGEETVEEPAAAITYGMLAFRSHSGDRAGVIPGHFPKGWVWPYLAWGQ